MNKEVAISLSATMSPLDFFLLIFGNPARIKHAKSTNSVNIIKRINKHRGEVADCPNNYDIKILKRNNNVEYNLPILSILLDVKRNIKLRMVENEQQQ